MNRFIRIIQRIALSLVVTATFQEHSVGKNIRSCEPDHGCQSWCNLTWNTAGGEDTFIWFNCGKTTALLASEKNVVHKSLSYKSAWHLAKYQTFYRRVSASKRRPSFFIFSISVSSISRHYLSISNSPDCFCYIRGHTVCARGRQTSVPIASGWGVDGWYLLSRPDMLPWSFISHLHYKKGRNKKIPLVIWWAILLVVSPK